MQNKLLKLVLKYDRRTPTIFLHHVLSILQLNDMHMVKVLSLEMNVDQVEFQTYSSIIIKFEKSKDCTVVYNEIMMPE